jgi:hypothetical protein
MRHQIPNCKPRTIRLHVPTYDAILDFFANSPSGITGSAAIREILMRFGNHCIRKRRQGYVAGPEDLADIEDIMLGMLGESPEEKPHA